MVGISSRGPALCGEPGYSAFATKVAVYLQWIMQRIDIPFNERDLGKVHGGEDLN